MPYYCQRGLVPPKRHTRLLSPAGKMYHEELMTSEGFTGSSSLLYRLRPPTRVVKSEKLPPLPLGLANEPMMQNHMVRMDAIKPAGDFLTGRVPLAANSDIVYSVVKPDAQLPAYYRNGYCDEMVVIAKGSGRVRTVFGSIDFGPLDFVCIPRGVTSSWQFDADSEQQYVVLESRTAIRPPLRFRASSGQLLERSPYHERDLRVPQWVEPESPTGEFPVLVKAGEHLVRLWFDAHPFDAVGWDGFYYPFALNMRDFNPTTGRVHQMPDALQAFETTGAVICCFSPALMEDHPEALPAQAHHMSTDYDEIFYRILDENDVAQTRPETGVGTITLHSRLLNHGPKPGYEGAPRRPRSSLFGLMIDVAKPLTPGTSTIDLGEHGYMDTWV
jgi:homogentisate 1,2-dioxygenase